MFVYFIGVAFNLLQIGTRNIYLNEHYSLLTMFKVMQVHPDEIQQLSTQIHFGRTIISHTQDFLLYVYCTYQQ